MKIAIPKLFSSFFYPVHEFQTNSKRIQLLHSLFQGAFSKVKTEIKAGDVRCHHLTVALMGNSMSHQGQKEPNEKESLLPIVYSC